MLRKWRRKKKEKQAVAPADNSDIPDVRVKEIKFHTLRRRKASCEDNIHKSLLEGAEVEFRKRLAHLFTQGIWQYT